METNNLVRVERCCAQLEVEFSFVHELEDHGLIEIVIVDDQSYISIDHLKRLERVIHFYYDLNINLEGIDVIHHLLGQIDDLQEELRITRNKLKIHDSR
ncbi:MAG: chaperone modulator CbpM [Bacteroidota bacterium]